MIITSQPPGQHGINEKTKDELMLQITVTLHSAGAARPAAGAGS